VRVKSWPTQSDVDRLHRALLEYDTDYDETVQDAAGLKKMKKLHKLLTDESHCRQTPYSFELRKCGRADCLLCPGTVRTPGTTDGELQERVLRYRPLPIKSIQDSSQFLSYEETLEKLDLPLKMNS
jgi:hypothetical protein